MPKISVSLTWREWALLWNNEGGYYSFGIGPLFVQIDFTGEVL